jgi:hypothetical protein
MKLTRRGILATSTVALAGCGLVPEESDPVEASASALGTDVTLTTATTTADGDVSTAWTRVRAGEDSVTAVATGGADAPFGAVTRDG